MSAVGFSEKVVHSFCPALAEPIGETPNADIFLPLRPSVSSKKV
jgi:hypothetical protein